MLFLSASKVVVGYKNNNNSMEIMGKIKKIASIKIGINKPAFGTVAMDGSEFSNLCSFNSHGGARVGPGGVPKRPHHSIHHHILLCLKPKKK